jgi:hypothetical protein
MSRFYFVPDNFKLSEDLRQFARDKGFSETDIEEQEEKWRDHQYIEEQEEKWRDHQYRTPRIDAARCWRNWVRNSIKFGDVTPSVTPQYRKQAELTEDQRTADIIKFERDMKRFGK